MIRLDPLTGTTCACANAVGNVSSERCSCSLRADGRVKHSPSCCIQWHRDEATKVDAVENVVSPDEWARRFKGRILARLSGPGTIWTQEAAEEAAREEYDSLDNIDTRDDPEDAADESLSYWDADE